MPDGLVKPSGTKKYDYILSNKTDERPILNTEYVLTSTGTFHFRLTPKNIHRLHRFPQITHLVDFQAWFKTG